MNQVPEETLRMRYLTHLNIFCLSISMLALTGCAAGQRSFSKGEQLEAAGNYEEAMYSYADAFRKDPDTGTYRARFFKARDKASEKRYKMGMEQLDRGDYVGALAEFQTAYGLDPTQDKYKQQMDATTRLKDAQFAYLEGVEFEKANKLRDATRTYLVAIELHPENKEYKSALARVNTQRKSKLEGFELSLKSSKPITLKFKDAKIKDVFTIITQLTGINFIFDDGVKDQTISIYLENATFQQAMDLLTNMYKLHTKILNESTVLVYTKTPEKSKQYEDLTLRTFHLSYMDAKKAVNLIRTMLQVKKIHVNEESNSLIVRDTGDIVDVVEKILEANDVPDPEVVLDVEVMEVTDKNTENLGLLLSNYNVQMGAFNGSTPLSSSLNTVSVSSSGNGSGATVTGDITTTTKSTINNLVRAFTMQGYGGYVTVPTAQYNFGKTLTKGEVLSNPKIRVKNKEKAKFNVGQRVPITTTTLNGTVSQVNVQYVDVGVKVNAEPMIQLNNEIIIKLSLEVSSILSKETVGGVTSPTSVVTIGTRNLDTVLSLKDGETSVIGGLIQNTQNNTKQKIYLLSDIPLIGPLLTGHDTSKDKTELILAITPRLVRSVTVPQQSLMSFSSGKEDDPTLARPMVSFDQEPVFESAPKTETGKTAPVKPATAKSVPVAQTPAILAPIETIPTVVNPKKPVSRTVMPKPAVTPPVKPVDTASNVSDDGDVEAEEVDSSDDTGEKDVAPVAQLPTGKAVPGLPTAVPVPPPAAITPQPVEVLPAPAKPAVAPVKRGLVQIAAPAGINTGQTFYADIKAGDVQDLAGATFVLTYNPAFVDFIKVVEGKFLGQDGKATVFSATPDAKAGSVTVKMDRVPNSGGISGNGTLVSVLFGAKNKGSASFGFSSVNFTAVDGKKLEILPFSTAVDVR
jgi:general secretion pathway protein D